jgi:hypothetical protein
LSSYLGFADYHQIVIATYASVVLELQALIPNTAKWVWGSTQEETFLAPKQAMVDAVLLHYPQWESY